MASSSSDAVARIGWDNTDARRGADQFVAISERAKRRSEEALGSIGSGVKFAAAFAGMDSAANLAGKALQGVKRGLDFNQTLSDSAVGIGNVLRRFDGLNKVAAQNEAAKALQRIIELEPITAGGLQDLVSGFMGTLAAAKGVGLTTRQNIELVAKFANAIANAGLPLDQIRQEFRSILTSTITKDSQIAKILGITNEDINQLRGNGDAIFAYLVGKLGEFGEAGDSATVTFSSFNSALDKALGETTQQLFNLAIKSAKQLTQQLQDPQWVEQMRDAGVDIAATAASLASIGEVLVQWLPTAVKLGARVSELVPSLIAIGAAITALKVRGLIKDKLDLGNAVAKDAAMLQRETSALQNNTAAQNANAAASQRAQQVRDRRSPYVGPDTRGFAGGASIDIGRAVNDARRAGSQAGQGFVGGFRTAFRSFPQTAGAQILTSINGFGTVVVAGLASAMSDRSKGIAGTVGKTLGGDIGAIMGPSLMDGLTVFLSTLGPYGALAGMATQTIDAAVAIGRTAGERMAENIARYSNGANAASRDRAGAADVRNLLDQGEEARARSLLENRLQIAREDLARAQKAGAGTEDLELEIGVLESMQKNWAAWVERSAATQQANREAEAAADQESEEAAKRKAEADERRAKAWQQIHSLTKDILQSKIDVLPDEQKIQAYQTMLRRLYQEASLGSGGTAGVASVDQLEALAKAQRAAGNAEGAAKTLERLKEARAITQQNADITAKMAKEESDRADDEAKKEDEIKFRREILDLEGQVQKAIGESGDEESAKVKALQDEIAAKQLARDLQRSLNIEEGKALEMARQRVAAEREAAQAVKYRQQQEALGDIEKELAIMREQAAGRDRKARALQRELEIQRDVQRIMEQTGASEAEALRLAQEKARLQDQIDKRQSRESGQRGKIYGYSAKEQGGRYDKPSYKSGLDQFYENQKTPLRDTFKFPGLDAYEEMQKTPLRDTFEFPALDYFDKTQERRKQQQNGTWKEADPKGNFDPGFVRKPENPLLDKARQNNAGADQQAQPSGQAAAQIVMQVLPQILERLSSN